MKDNSSIYTILTQFKTIPAGEMPAIKTHVNTQDYKFCFTLSSEDIILKVDNAQDRDALALFSSVQIFYTCNGNGFVQPLEYKKQVENEKITLHCITQLPTLKDKVNFTNRSAWMMYLVFEIDDGYTLFRVKESGENATPKKKGDVFYNRTNQFYEPYESFVIEDIDMVSMVVISRYGNYSLVTMERENRYAEQFVLTLKDMTISGNQLSIIATTEGKQRNWTNILIKYRGQKNEDIIRYELPINQDKDCLTAKCDLSTLQFVPTIWDIYAVFEENGQTYRIRVKIGEKAFYNAFCKLSHNNIYKAPDGYILFPYRTKNGSIGLNYRKETSQDSFQVRLFERMALRYYEKHKEKLDNQNIFLVYEKYSQMAQDNGYYFFKYCMENDMESKMNRKIYYVIDKKSPDYEKLKPYKKNVIHFLSFKYFVYMQAAKLLISSDNRLHAFVWHPLPSYMPNIISEKKHVFLQHGVTALKKVRNVFDRQGQFATNLFIVTSEMEKMIVSKNYHYLQDELAVTGFARWDVLEDHSTERKEIMIMPTWRNWLDDMTDEEFCQTDYYKNYTALLNSERLKELLEKNDCYVNFYIHPKFREYIKNFDSKLDRVRLISFDEEPMNQLLMSCKLLITDYSSVSWDVFYQGKPVLFYQFDLAEYNQANGSFIDMEKDLFGDRAMELDGLLDLIEQSINNHFTLEEKYKAKLKDSFAYIDDQNSARICEVLMKKNW